MDGALDTATPADRMPAVRTLAMPGDTNPAGDIFGGWLLSQMDVAGGIVAYRRAGGRVATVAIDAIAFHAPVAMGDVVSCYAEVVLVGRTSLAVHVETWVERLRTGSPVKVTDGRFTYVALAQDGQKRVVPEVDARRW